MGGTENVAGTAGLGASTITMLAASNPEHIYFSGRNTKKADELIEEVHKLHPSTKITFLECDNSNLSSVKACATKFLAQADRLDVLMCNAGIMAWDPSLSKDGYEIQFATNHLGHALLIKLLMPVLEKTADAPNSDVRIVNLSSVGYKTTPPAGIDFATLKTSQSSIGRLTAPGKWARYGQSKLANLLYARALAKHHPKITSVAVHPGYIRTDLFLQTSVMDRLPVMFMARGKWVPVEQGCWNQTWAATVPKEELMNGAYYEPVAQEVTPETRMGRNDELVERLWEWTEKELKSS
jgi:NAD(P)-dependent dehydrogenase (short-subunit alcohol dehydrogenase family)